ncbi:type B DNA-directed DNA polymerase [Halovivax gelatinilyticus]|uniref:type B DNA-directed DNA polymerase n=1 Tax=Halovivax gelatinilyticus TaxID=2961597 RepID=UPI0020CA6842|nr:type B DNA-directed DNA polymerase [Halovivax gelatinilyticus]
MTRADSDSTESEPDPFTFEFPDGAVRAWRLTETGAVPIVDESYEPAVFVAGPDRALDRLANELAADPKVTETAVVDRYTTLHDTKGRSSPEPVLRVAIERIGEVRTLARELAYRTSQGSHRSFDRDATVGGERSAADGSFDTGRSSGVEATAGSPDWSPAPGTIRLFDVDLEPGFRYCLDREVDPAASAPNRALRRFHIEIDERALANRDVSTLRVGSGTVDDGAVERETIEGKPASVLETLSSRLERTDPDVLVLSHADLVPLLSETADANGLDSFELGRLAGWSRVAGENTYASYGQIGHSPARYRVPGRAIVDESNSFLWHQSGLSGLLYMVQESGRPLQEAAWGSIGTILTSRQIRQAREWDVLAPWNKWEPERFKDARTLHEADRGGFTFAPEVGFHETVHEIDFASLYPRIICEHNVSPETVDCACCRPGADGTPRDRTPGLDYRICRREGFLPDVLEGLLDDRANLKRALREDDPSDAERRRWRGESGAIKWVLVSCFGYQGYRNAKFGRIECHEAINDYARDIALTAKERLEAGGWRIVHGIVDSLWVTAAVDDPEPLKTVCADVSASVGIPLEHDGAYEWVCFVPRRSSIAANATTDERTVPSSALAGALTRYFGKREDGTYKYRGIEVRQRSTPTYVSDCQREFIETLDDARDPAVVCDRLQRHIGELERGSVDPVDLVITKRVSKSLGEYTQATHTVAALERYDELGVSRKPGQSVAYVVVDDGARRTRERVRLALEDGGVAYDSDYYATLLIRAAESVVSPLGWDRARIRRYLADTETTSLSAFGG